MSTGEESSLRSSHSDLTAEIYALDKPLDRVYRDVDYHVRHLAGLGLHVLELACGTGRVLLPLVEAGIDADGLDHAPGMLERCRQAAAERGLETVLYELDMASFRLPRQYDVIVAAAGAIKELPGREAVLGALASCRDALVPGGLLVVDLVPPRTSSLAASRDRPDQPAPMRYWRRGPVQWTLQTVLLDYDSAQDRTTILRRYERYRDGVLERAELHEFCMQHWTLDTFELMLRSCGYSDIEVVADYEDGRSPGPADRDWTVTCRRD